MAEFFSIMFYPFLACLVLTGIHAYLGFHVIERQVIFVDLAIAQIAVLGAGCAILFGQGIDSGLSYWLSLGFTMIGAAILAGTRFKSQKVPQEAIIGIVYAVSAALLILVLSRSGEGDDHIKEALVGNILLVSPPEIISMAVIYSAVGIVHYFFRDPFLLISSNAEAAYAKGLSVRWWDFLFYLTFGLVVTSSVRVAGVLLVFSFLVVPSVAAIIFCQGIKRRLIFGWVFGFVASVLGITASYVFDQPTGACVVVSFGAALILVAVFKAVFGK